MFEINDYQIHKKNRNCESIDKYLFANQFANQQLTQVAFELINDAIIITDCFGSLQFINPAAEKLTGLSLQDIQSLPIYEALQFINQNTFEPLENCLEKVLSQNHTIKEDSNCLLVRSDHTLLSIQKSIAPIHDHNGEVLGLVFVLRDMSHFSELGEGTSLLIQDSLSGLTNRYSFEKFLQEAISSTQNSEQIHALCYLDLDHFKIINETCSHEAGDEFLRQISALLQKRVRKSDVLARLGADEFGLLLYQCGLDSALKVINILREEVKKFQFVWGEHTFNFSLSVGIVILKDNSENSSSLLNLADSACTMAKSKGRNRVQIYEANDIELVNQRGEIRWLSRIFKALEENQFVLYHQSIVSLASREQGERKSCEILVRLQDEDGKIIPPGAFIPAAEKHGLMHLIDRWVISNLFTYLGKNCSLSEKSVAEKMNYSINLSGASLNDDRFFDFVREQLTLHSISPEIICFEITETLAISNLNQARLLMRELKALGCSFALDDFGSGMSSFGYLKSLPIDYLKIDGVFIKDILENQVTCEIVEAINRIAHIMEIKTVAEYVENKDIMLKLRQIGIDFAQGYGIAKPSSLIVSS